MGYACPVCGSPQADGEHLANHLAFTAMLHGGEHEAWLDEHVPDWADRDPDGLAAEVVERAEETDHETVFEDATGGRPDVELGRGHGRGRRRGRHNGEAEHHRRGGRQELDPETRRTVEEAVEMTRRLRSGGDAGNRPEGDEDAEE